MIKKITISALLYLFCIATSNANPLTETEFSADNLSINIESLTIRCQIESTRSTDDSTTLILKHKDHEVLVINQSAMNKLSAALKHLAKQVCTLDLIPETVTVSVGLLSATWQTAKLCG